MGLAAFNRKRREQAKVKQPVKPQPEGEKQTKPIRKPRKAKTEQTSDK